MNELLYPFNSEYILKKKKSLIKELQKQTGLVPKKIAILSGSTVGITKDILGLFLLNYGFEPTFYQGEYNRFYEDAVFDVQTLVDFAPDIVYIHTSMRNILHFPKITSQVGEDEALAKSEMERFIDAWDSLKEKVRCPIIQNSFEPCLTRPMGNAEAYYNNGTIRYINLINNMIYKYAREYNDFYVNDLNYQAALYGLERWFDNSAYYLYKYPFALNAIPLVCYNIANIIKSIFGKNKKSVVVDLDNTLWGGIIGDDGVENIKIGNETSIGMAFSDIQKYIKRLMDIGISVSVCSKNDDANARQGFEHPSSELKVNDFTVFKANWKNKDINIHEIATEINIIEDSMVYIDDNPAERALIREAIKGITVPELTVPEEYVNIIDKSGFFEVTALSTDDKNRNQYYKDNQKRKENMEQFSDYNAYLRSLEMSSSIVSFNKQNIERVVQLINKTNQFNLTTKRMTIDEVNQYISDPDTITLCATLDDRFGSNGIVSCLIASREGDTMIINLWVMSCRVFKRGLEEAVLDALVKQCKTIGVKKIKGLYFPTKKNKYVEKLYESLGFEEIDNIEGSSIWEFTQLKNYIDRNEIIIIKVDYNE